MYEKEEMLLVKIATLFYEDGLTQEEIGKLLNLSRIQVHRRLKMAVSSGLVSITINSPKKGLIDLASRVKKSFGLKDVIVTKTSTDLDKTRDIIGKEAGEYIVSQLNKGDFVGVSWGQTVKAMVDNLPEANIKDITVSNIIGGLSTLGDKGAQDIAIKMSSILKGTPQLLNLPFKVDSIQIKEAILKDSGICKIINNLKSANMIIVGIGDLNPSVIKYAIYKEGITSTGELEKIKDENAVGEIIGRYYDLDGNVIYREQDKTIIGLELENLRSIPKVIGVAGGENKVLPILGAIKGNYINTLVTDEDTANSILKKAMELKIIPDLE